MTYITCSFLLLVFNMTGNVLEKTFGHLNEGVGGQINPERLRMRSKFFRKVKNILQSTWLVLMGWYSKC